MLLGQYSTGKTTFIKHLLRTSYPGAHIGPEPTTDRFVVVMVGSILSQDVTGCLYLCRHIPGNIAVCITVCLYFTFVHHIHYKPCVNIQIWHPLSSTIFYFLSGQFCTHVWWLQMRWHDLSGRSRWAKCAWKYYRSTGRYALQWSYQIWPGIFVQVRMFTNATSCMWKLDFYSTRVPHLYYASTK